MEENQVAKSGSGKVILWIIAIVLVVAGFYFMKSDGRVANMMSKDVIVAEDGSVSGMYSIKDLMALGAPLQCSFALNKEDVNVTGSVVIYGKDVRGDFDISGTPIGTIASHFIVKDNVSYTWTSIANVGYKGDVTKSSTSASQEDQASIVGVNDDVEYSCAPWNPDLTRFHLPSGITFSELE